MQVTLNPYISASRQIKQNQSQNISFQAIRTPLAKRAMNPIHQEKGLMALCACVIYLVKSIFGPKLTTGSDNLDRKIEDYTYQNKYGSTSLLAHYADAKGIKEMNEDLKDYPQILSMIYLTKNSKGKNPLYEADLAKMQEINRALANQPEVLEKIYLQKNKKGKIKAHNCEPDEMREMNKLFADRPDILKKIHLSKNKRGMYPIDYAEHETQREILNLFTYDEKTQSKLLDSLEGK